MGKERDRLEAALERMLKAVERVGDEVSSELGGLPGRIDRELRKERERQERKEARRRLKQERKAKAKQAERRRKQTVQPALVDLATGATFLFIALVMIAIALRGTYWMVFVALGLGIAGAQSLAKGLAKRSLAPQQEPSSEPEAAQAPAAAAHDEGARLDEVASQLLREIQAGPAVLREIVGKPAQTVEGLRRGYHALAERERVLRASLLASDDERLAREETELKERIRGERDDVARRSYEQALAALQLQKKEREAMATAANRLQGERTRLRLTLESLLAQVIRTRALHGTGDAGADALRNSLERLSDEVGAVAEALEAVGTGAPLPVSPIASDGGRRPRGRDRAD